jgi:S1-C subfamily serine protease
VILSIDGSPTSTTAQLTTVLAALGPGQSVPVAVRNQSGAKVTRQVTLGTYPGS